MASISELQFLIPEIVIGLMICVVLLAVCFPQRPGSFLVYGLTQFGYLLAFAASLALLGADEQRLMAGNFVIDNFTDVARPITLALAMIATLYAQVHLLTHNNERGEFYLFGLFAVLGMLVVITAGSLLTMYIGIELMSLSMYVMIAYDRGKTQSGEAAVKFFILSSLATGLLLYGFSLIYGATGHIMLIDIQKAILIGSDYRLLALAGVALVLVGAAFKLALVPFHFWIPDVYEGGNLASVAFIASVPKLAGLAILTRMLTESLSALIDAWQPVLLSLALLAIIFGNIAALTQTNIRRLLAYSSVGHMGFVALALSTGSATGYANALFYTIVYAVAALGIFGLLIEIDRRGTSTNLINELAALHKRFAHLAFLMLLLLFSMAGIPPLLGFFAKYGVIVEALHVNLLAPALIAVVGTVIGAFYYLRVVRAMYFDNTPPDSAPIACVCDPLQIRFMVWINALAVLILGLAAQPLVNMCLRVYI